MPAVNWLRNLNYRRTRPDFPHGSGHDPARNQDSSNIARPLAVGKKFPDAYVPSIEEIQDIVEETLTVSDFFKTAKAYILYRTEVREQHQPIPDHIRQQVDESKQYFSNLL